MLTDFAKSDSDINGAETSCVSWVAIEELH